MSNIKWGFPGGSALKNSLVMQKLQKTQGQSPGLGEFPRVSLTIITLLYN